MTDTIDVKDYIKRLKTDGSLYFNYTGLQEAAALQQALETEISKKEILFFLDRTQALFVDMTNKLMSKDAAADLARDYGFKAPKSSVVSNTAEPTDLTGFIWDKDQIIEKRVFTSHRLNQDTFAFGIKLPKTEDIIDRKSSMVLGQEQVWKPVIVASSGEMWPVSKWKEREHKISYESIPEEMVLRWDLAEVEKYYKKKGDVEKIDSLKLFSEIRKEYELYNYYRESNWYVVNALWDIGTYLHQLFSAYPLKEERGLHGTGKTKTMSVSSQISLNGTEIMVNPSEATLFRITESLRPTKYIDEAEKLFRITKNGPETDNRVELINASYTRDGAVPRQEKQKDVFITKWYHVYSPTRISSINGLFGATESRAITQVHTKAPDADRRGEKEPGDDVKDPKWQAIRNRCYLWTLQNWKQVLEAYTNFNTETKLKSRDLQLWKPLIVICQVINSGLVPELIQFAEKLAEQRKIESLSDGSLDYQLLSSVNKLLPATDNKVYVEAIRYELDRQYPLDLMSTPRKKGYNKTITTHLDRLGLADLKGKDRSGAYYELSQATFDEIVSPITSDFSSHSSQSSHTEIKQAKIGDESVTHVTNNENNGDSSHSSLVTNPKIVNARRQGDGSDANEANSGQVKAVLNQSIKTGLQTGVYLNNDFEVLPEAMRPVLRGMARSGEIVQYTPGYWKYVQRGNQND